ncbi:adenine deaminase [Shewanella sp. NFH-SH190041]|uniref:adenine deaminase n=1 Tax=Shewanella sp. NFH-SH190041 TaxID=2950245 RepID=UPI0021C49E2F|nr:adenine deaminase [Shewanella sp. NFH-SH190041]BDM64358.1 adenine deaminase [Shewanella sp. NFH-SH190041]
MADLMHKHTQQLSRQALEKLLAVQRGELAADLRLENLHYLDLVFGDICPGPVVICGQHIAALGAEAESIKAHRTVDCQGAIAVPGFIDAHMHIESSTMTPFEFECTTLPLGTTSVVCDPHELTNVIGTEAIDWFLRCSQSLHQNMFVQVSSCVPAVADLDINGASLALEQMQMYREHPNVLGLAEVMDYPGVIGAAPAMLDKLSAFSNLNLDGHCPLLTGLPLSAYISSGIRNCHETSTLTEGQEKLRKGMSVIIREGSVAKNLDALAPLISETTVSQCLLCTDDRNPHEIIHEGHLDFMVRRLINRHGIAPYLAYRAASWSAAKHFGLQRLGLLAPGYRADINLVGNLDAVNIQRVVCAGQFVDELPLRQNLANKLAASQPPLQPTLIRHPVTARELTPELQPGQYHVIDIIENELLTADLVCDYDGQSFNHAGINHVAVLERYGHQLPASLGLIRGFSVREGAIAGSVGHDSHNLIVIGADPTSMAIAVNHIITLGGGYCVVRGGKVTAELELPLGGLMSLATGEQISQDIAALKQAAAGLGVNLPEPFVQMSFIALPVIPSLKLTAKGLVDVNTFRFIPLKLS